MDSMSLDSGEDSKADDMDEMAMPNPGSIQVVNSADLKGEVNPFWHVSPKRNSEKSQNSQLGCEIPEVRIRIGTEVTLIPTRKTTKNMEISFCNLPFITFPK